jgi:EAL domain
VITEIDRWVIDRCTEIAAAGEPVEINVSARSIASAASRHVVQAVVSLAAAFEMETVGEGVEDQGTLDLLRELGVDYAQGFHIGRPALIETGPAASSSVGCVLGVVSEEREDPAAEKVSRRLAGDRWRGREQCLQRGGVQMRASGEVDVTAVVIAQPGGQRLGFLDRHCSDEHCGVSQLKRHWPAPP